MKPIHTIAIILGTMILTLALFAGGVYFGKRLDNICLGTDMNPIEGLAEMKGEK